MASQAQKDDPELAASRDAGNELNGMTRNKNYPRDGFLEGNPETGLVFFAGSLYFLF